MANNVIIPVIFEPDTTKVESSINRLQNSGAIDENDAKAFKEGNTELAKRNALHAAENKLIAALTTEQNKQAATIKTLQQQVDRLTNSFIKETEASTTARSESEKNAKSTTSLKAEKKKLAESIAELLVKGEKESEMYAKLVARAGELDDALKDANATIARAGSDTRGLDNAIQITSAVAGGFAAAQGAAALFGDENENLQKTLLKVTAAMGILQGLQQIQAVLRDESIKSLAVEVRTRILNNAQITIENGLNSKSVIVRRAATAAQWALNTAMKANQIGALVAALIVIISTLALFISSSSKAAKAQSELANAIKSATDGLNAEIDGISRSVELQKQELEISGARLSNIQNIEIAGKRAAAQAIVNSIKQLDASIKLYDTDTDKYKEAVAKKRELEDNLNKANSEGKMLVAVQQKQLLNESQNDAIQAAENSIKLAKNGSAQEIKLMQSAAATKRKIALENADKIIGTEAERAAERAKIEAEYIDTVQGLNEQLYSMSKAAQARRLAAEKAAIDNLLIAVKEGSEEELNIRIKQIQKQVEIDKLAIDRRGVSMAIILQEERNIANKANTEREKLEKQFADKRDMNARQIEASHAQTRVAAYREGSDLYIAAQQVALMRQADVEILAVNQSTDTEKVKAAKILLINANLNKQLDEIDRERIRREFERKQQLINDLDSIELSRLNRKASDPTLSDGKRFKAEIAVINKEIEVLEHQRVAIHQKALDGQYESWQQYYADLAQNEEELDAKREIKSRTYQEREIATLKTIKQAAIQIGQEMANALFDIDRAQREASLRQALDNLETERQAAISSKNLTERQKDDIQKKYDIQAKRLKNEAARKERKAAIAQALVSGALAIVQAFAQLGPIAGAIAAALVAATTAIQISKINSTPLPAYAKGTKSAKKGYALVGEEGPEIVQFAGGERVWTAQQTKKVRSQWDKKMHPDEILANRLPSDHTALIEQSNSNSQSDTIDYDKLGKALAKYMPESPHMEMNADNNGLSMYMLTRNRKIKILNKRYSTS